MSGAIEVTMADLRIAAALSGEADPYNQTTFRLEYLSDGALVMVQGYIGPAWVVKGRPYR